MSSARRPAKCSSACLRCAGQKSPPVQRRSFSSSSRATPDPHTGQAVGIVNARASPGRRCGSTATTCGMTSPARRTVTVSPIIRSSVRM